MAAGAAGGGGGGGAIRAGRAFVELFAQDNKLYRALDAAQARVKAFGAATAKIGAGLFGLGAVGGGVGLSKVLDSLGDTARISATAKALGLTAEQFSGIAGVASTTGEGIREFIESMVTLGKVVDEGVAGKGEVAGQFFKDIGVSAKEFAALRPDEQFYKLFESLKAVEDPAKRVRALMTAFGEDGGKHLLPLLSKAPAELREMAKGFALTGEEAAAAESASAAYGRVTATLSTMWAKVASAAAPVVESVAGVLDRALTPLSAWISENRPAVEAVAAGFFGVAAAATAVGAGLAAVGGAGYVAAGIAAGVGALASAAATAAGAVGAVVSAVAAAPLAFAAVGAAAAGVAAAFLTMTDSGEAVTNILGKALAGDFAGAFDDAAAGVQSAWGSVLAWIDDHFGETIRNLTETWGAVVNAVGSGDLGTAASLAFDGLRVEWARVTVFMTDQWNGFKETFVDGWHSAVAAVSKALADLTGFFLDQIGAVLNLLGDLISLAPGTFARLGIDAGGVDALRGRLAADPEGEKAAIDRAAAAAQAERDAARAADSNAAAADLAAAERRAAERRVEALNGANMDAFFKSMLAGFPADAGKPRPVPGASDLPALGRSITSFGGFRSVANEFGGGGGGVKELIRVAKDEKVISQRNEGHLIDIRDAIKGLEGGTFA